MLARVPALGAGHGGGTALPRQRGRAAILVLFRALGVLVVLAQLYHQFTAPAELHALPQARRFGQRVVQRALLRVGAQPPSHCPAQGGLAGVGIREQHFHPLRVFVRIVAGKRVVVELVAFRVALRLFVESVLQGLTIALRVQAPRVLHDGILKLAALQQIVAVGQRHTRVMHRPVQLRCHVL